MILKILALLGLFATVFAAKSYENYKVYNVKLNTESQVQRIEDLKKEGYEIWTDHLIIGEDARIMVAPEKTEEFVKYTSTAGLNSTLTVDNVQLLIDAQMIPAKIDRSATLGSFNWIQYHTLEEIHAWLDELVELFPGIVTTVNLGTSHEGRALKAVVIDFKAGAREGTPLVGMIEGGIHAREWISPATVTWIIKEFLTSEDPDVRVLAETFVWHIIPVTNPDGYAYTFNGNRMWRKNRNPANHIVCNNGNTDFGNGIDLNRNFNYLWMTVGASDQPCSETYAGPGAASELETQAIQNYVLNLKTTGNLMWYLAFHSFSQMILIPYSHVSGIEVLQVSNYADLYEITIRGAEKLESLHGIPYRVGTSQTILYEVSGSSFDWAKGVAEVPLAALFELRDNGSYGFLLPTDQIIPNNEEIMVCLVEMDKTAKKLNYYVGSSVDSGSDDGAPEQGNSGAILSPIMSFVITIGFLVLLK